MSEPVILDHATLYHDDCLSVLKTLPENSVDSVICDPPAGIAFMNKRFDSDRGGRDKWIDWLATIFKEVYRVMKPGAHGLVWALPRTSHWTAMALDNAGFNIRDRISYAFDASELAKAFLGSLNEAQRELWERLMESQDVSRVQHYFGSGFPKALDVSAAIDQKFSAKRDRVINPRWIDKYPNGPAGNKTGGDHAATIRQLKSISGNPLEMTLPATKEAAQWYGWKSSLKPAVEDYWLIRKPLEGSIAENVMKWECGGLNIDKCRVGTETTTTHGKRNGTCNSLSLSKYTSPDHFQGDTRAGRYPAHLILDGSEAVCGRFPNTTISKGGGGTKSPCWTPSTKENMNKDYGEYVGYLDSGSAARFFKSCPIDPFIYHSKASAADRNEGCDGLEARFSPTTNDGICGKEHNPEPATPKRNSHPTVKSTSLFSYFATLLTKPGGLILDPFMGSGTTGVAAVKLGYRFIGCEMEVEYFAIAQARIKSAQKQPSLFHEA